VVIERVGLVRSIDDAGSVSDPFIDITDRVAVETDLGLLGLALHPDFEANGRLFLAFATVADTVVAEFAVDLSGEAPTAEFVRDLLSYPHVRDWHQGGRIDFGPDGLLYVGAGDGGDPARSQDPDSLPGSILRVDVDAARPYAIPPENAFAGRPASEVFVFGLRNPYQFWIDPVTRLLHVGDVGEATSEEISVVPLDAAGANLGWPIKEGHGCWEVFDLRLQFGGCDDAGFLDPVLSYGHAPDCAVVGGPVYRGDLMPELDGWAFFADFCSRWIRAYRYDGDRVAATARWAPSPESAVTGSYIAFGLDHDGEVLVLTTDRIYRLVPGT